MDSPSTPHVQTVDPEDVDDGDDEVEGKTLFDSGLGWPFYALLALPLILLLWGFSDLGVALQTVVIALLGLAASGLVWLVWLVSYALLGGRRFGPFMLAPAMVILTVALLALGVPARLRWELSRPAFDAVAAQQPMTQPGNTLPERIGLYGVRDYQPVPGGWIVYENGGHFFDDAGFAYLPAGPTPDLGDSLWDLPSSATSAARGTAGPRAGSRPAPLHSESTLERAKGFEPS